MAKKYVLKKTSRDTSRIPIVDESKFTINYQTQLNLSQYEAVKALEGVYLVIAGAGTGKTRTLVYRVARMVEMGIDPKSILLLTFTRKAAKEMLNRAAMLLDSRCSRINGGTFHSFANITLRRNAKHIGLEQNFTILDQGDSQDVISLIRGQLKLGEQKRRFPNKSTINKVLSLSTNTGRLVSEILETDYPHFSIYKEQFAQIKELYEKYKFQNNLLDYDDLLIYLRKFLTSPSAATKAFLSDIKFIMIDEYQDTNMLQADIVKALAAINPNVMVVGDDSQSIYSFRGADFKNIIQFPNLFEGTEIIKLEENFRSTQPILNLANKIIERSIEKYSKELYTRKIDGELPVIISATNENMQSRFIVERILEMREEGIALEEIAVLFRSSYMSFDLEIELNKANVPYVKIGGMKFIETAHVKDILAFLRISANPSDFVSWYRVLLLHEGIGPKKAQMVLDQVSHGVFSIKHAPTKQIADQFGAKIYNLFKLLNELHVKQTNPMEKAEKAYSYYEPIFLTKYDDFNKRRKDLEILLNMTNNYSTVDSFLDDMALDPPTDSVVDVDPTSNENERLTLSTIHSAKGLEWHSVFIIHAVDGFFPSSQSLANLDSLEEERRLMYVASTRAKENLYICYPMNIFDRHQGLTLSKPSRFIEGIPDDIAEEWLLEEE
ncbi:MAG: ATP-dependent helicase [Melioribacteraceae bacterium]|nr:ATP-dependent helicase [Melioribacteraceae bacterium]MCF8414021.1 ATP-dependent helicase [Melioribacteraceae bacterium]